VDHPHQIRDLQNSIRQARDDIDSVMKYSDDEVFKLSEGSRNCAEAELIDILSEMDKRLTKIRTDLDAASVT
jgi:hypothetical protein